MKSLSIKGSILAASVVAIASLGSVAAKAEYPERPVEMTVLFGGTANTIAQLLSGLMSDNLGQPVVPVSRTGGGGAIGYTYVQSTQPDGYNIVWNSNSVNTARHLGVMPISYQDFEPIAQISLEIPVLAVNSSTGWKSLADMTAALKASGARINVGTSGDGSFTHLTSIALFNALGLQDQVNYISYGKGNAPVELLAGRIDAAIQWPGQFLSFVQSGEITVLASTGKKRVSVMPDVMTASEQGADIDITMWRGLAAPKGTPAEVIAKLEEAARKAVESSQFTDAATKIGFEPSFMGSSEFGAIIARDDQFYGELLKELGMAK